MSNILKNLKIISNYDFFSFIRLIIDILITKTIFGKQFRRVKSPYYISGKKYINFGNGFSSGINLRIEVLPKYALRVEMKSNTEFENPKLDIGNEVQINDNVHIACIESITIGNNVLVGSNILITDHNHGRYSHFYTEQDSPLIPPNIRPLASKPVIINDNVWIGDFVSILPGTQIGEGSIIGTQSVVSSNIPPFSIAVGSPAKIIKKFDFTINQWIKV